MSCDMIRTSDMGLAVSHSTCPDHNHWSGHTLGDGATRVFSWLLSRKHELLRLDLPSDVDPSECSAQIQRLQSDKKGAALEMVEKGEEQKQFTNEYIM